MMRHERHIDEILDIIDDRLASYDEYRKQVDSEMAAEGIVWDGLQLAIKNGQITVGDADEQLNIFRDASI